MKAKLFEILIVVVFLFILAAVCGCEEEPEYQKGWQAGFDRAWADYEKGFNHGIRSPHNVYKREYQTSEYQYSGFSKDIIEILCEQNDIDYEGEWLFSCPKCETGGARTQKTLSGSICYNWNHRTWALEEAAPDEVVDSNDFHGQTYCGKCLYPVGTDWKIIDLTPKSEPNYTWSVGGIRGDFVDGEFIRIKEDDELHEFIELQKKKTGRNYFILEDCEYETAEPSDFIDPNEPEIHGSGSDYEIINEHGFVIFTTHGE